MQAGQRRFLFENNPIAGNKWVHNSQVPPPPVGGKRSGLLLELGGDKRMRFRIFADFF
jgi:hypothetical protein